MRPPLLLALVLGVLACDQAKTQPLARVDAGTQPPTPVEVDYVCELSDPAGLLNMAWKPYPISEVTGRFLGNSTTLPVGVPPALEAELTDALSLWSVRLPENQRAWVWVRPGLGDARSVWDWSVAIAEEGGPLREGPRSIERWQGTENLTLQHIAASGAGEIALITADEALLIGVDGSVHSVGVPPYGVVTVKGQPDGGFALVVRDRLGVYSLAWLSREDGFKGTGETIVTLPNQMPPIALLSLDDGYLVAWEEDWPSRLMFRRLDQGGSPLDDARELLPPPDPPHQRQLDWVRYEQTIALLWVEAERIYDPPSDADGNWPLDDDRYLFMLISASDLQPRSEPVEIPKQDGLGDPRIILQDGELLASAHFGRAKGDGHARITPSSPVAIECDPSPRDAEVRGERHDVATR